MADSKIDAKEVKSVALTRAEKVQVLPFGARTILGPVQMDEMSADDAAQHEGLIKVGTSIVAGDPDTLRVIKRDTAKKFSKDWYGFLCKIHGFTPGK